MTRIFTVGFELPGDDFEYVEFDSDATLLDADIVLFEPTLGIASSYEKYNGKALFDETSSFSVPRRLEHWRAEIAAAVNAGKLVIVYLAKPEEAFRYTGKQTFSGTGRSRVTTNMVAEISSYQCIPNLKRVTPKVGTEMRLDRDAKYLASYWSEFCTYSPYEVEIHGDFKRVLLRTPVGDRILGAAVHSKAGTLLFLPPIRYDKSKFLRYDAKSAKSYWTKEALQFGKRLVAAVVALAKSVQKTAESTPPPAWANALTFRFAEEARLEVEISRCAAQITELQAQKTSLEHELMAAGGLRGLLFEQGKPLELSVLEALRLLGFAAEPFDNGESEFDAVFVSPEGRCLGECEGKENKAVNIDKFSQLERNLQEDFARDEVTEYAKGVLFGNAFRLVPPTERDAFFTEKCLSAAKRAGIALVRTPDLFAPAKYMKETPADVAYAVECRKAMFLTAGDMVIFPPTPGADKSTVSRAEAVARSALDPDDDTVP